MGLIGKKRQKAAVQVQNRYSRPACVSSYSQAMILTKTGTCPPGRNARIGSQTLMNDEAGGGERSCRMGETRC
jgi:hypothetical protein